MNKQTILQKVITELEKEISAARQSFQSTKQAAIEAPGAMQSHSDTTKFQMNVLSDNIKHSVEEKEASLRDLKQLALNSILASDAVSLNSLVGAKDTEGKMSFFFILSGGGGIRVADGDYTITVIIPASPLAQAFMGKRAGEEAIFESPVTKQKKTFKIIDVY